MKPTKGVLAVILFQAALLILLLVLVYLKIPDFFSYLLVALGITVALIWKWPNLFISKRYWYYW